jgi:putative methyltransferase (TIGR04325 family)
MNFKQVLKKLVPPLLLDIKYWLTKRAQPQILPDYEYIPEGWAREKTETVRGWDTPDVLNAYASKWPAFVDSIQGVGPIGIAYEATGSQPPTHQDIVQHNILISYAYVAALAARQKTKLSMLDWGGGIGQYYLITKAALPTVEIEYTCKDVPILVEYGTTQLPGAHFYSDDSCLDQQYDLVLVSGAIQYSRDWKNDLARFARATRSYLYLARVPILHESASGVMLQRAQRYGYNTEYLGWFFNYQELLDAAKQSGLVLQREFFCHSAARIHGLEEVSSYYSFLFEPAPSSAASHTGKH